MTISSTTNRVSYSGNGSTTVFSFPYNFFSSSDLVVISRVNSTGVETVKTLTTHYTVTGAGVDGGGSVTMLSAPATGTTLIIYRDTAATQSMTAETDFFDTSSVEDALDRAAQATQRLVSRVDRAVRLTEGHPAGFDPKLPELLVPNAVLAVNSGGTAFEWGPDQDELLDAVTDASASATAAASSASSASSSATSAATSATNSASSATAAAASAVAAAASAVDAANNAAASVSDTAYNATSWDGVTTIAPSKNAVRDKIESMVDDTAYNATSWDGVTTAAPSKNAVRDQVETMLTSISGLVSDTAYNATTWDGVTGVAPSKNAVRDKIEAMVDDTAYNATTWDGVTTAAPSKNAVRDQFEALRDLSETLTNKTMTSPIINTPKLDGATASNTSRWTLPGASLAAITALTRKAGTIIFGTDTLKPYIDTGSTLVGLGGSGGGAALQWIEDANAPLAIFENSSRVYTFEAGLAQLLYATIKVPSTYTAGDPINLRMVYYNADTSGNALITSVATLVRTGTDLMSSTTNQRTSTNGAVTMSGATQNKPQALTLDLTSTTGTINSVAVAAGDIIKISITRGSDTATSDIKVPVFGAEVTFS